jgi:hypothetical protein
MAKNVHTGSLETEKPTFSGLPGCTKKARIAAAAKNLRNGRVEIR